MTPQRGTLHVPKVIKRHRQTCHQQRAWEEGQIEELTRRIDLCTWNDHETHVTQCPPAKAPHRDWNL